MIQRVFRNNKDLILVLGVVLILTVLFSPIPAAVLDMAIIMNFGLGLTILLLTFYVAKPVDFSTFPSILLIATLYRLALNVAATRLILTGGEAGDVIGSIGTYAVSGNFIVGLVVFLILVVVQFIVVTAGAQRVSEVAARFMLDSMPGQQMSIDADLNMGLIDQTEAKQKREALEKEANFYGAMDGASKFVKGDAIAGIIIILIDIIAGWIIGVMQMGMSWDEALRHFTLLTVGDGIATQLPALIISVATGIIVTRSASDGDLSSEVFKQLASVPRIPLIVAGVLTVMLFLPGMPKWPVVLLVALALYTFLRIRRAAAVKAAEDAEDESAKETGAGGFPALEVAFGPALSEAWKDQGDVVMERVAALRDTHERRLGLAFPAVKLADGADVGSNEYEIKLFGSRYAGGQLDPEMVLAVGGGGENGHVALDGTPTSDPVFGLPAIWIQPDKAEEAQALGASIIDPVTVLITHLGDVLEREASTLLTRATVVRLLDEVRGRQAGLVEELIPNVLTVSDVQRVLQNLLSEGISIKAIDLIVEHLVDLARQEKDIVQLTELVRQRMAHTICDGLRARHRDLAVLSLDPRVENQIQSAVAANGDREGMAIEPRLAEQLIRKLAMMAGDMRNEGRSPVLLCGTEIRRQLRSITQRSVPKLSILSVAEIPMNIELKSYDVVRIES